jgi:2-C-methyl-D-erythritol 4-phosphate cytidylyltransferase / 2-C-methyl-D-erythritol 2,4-cyclodiphosphate synthase
MPMSVAALIVAAGRGTRAAAPSKAGLINAAPAKQYALLGNRTVLARACDAFVGHPGIDMVQVVIHPDDTAAYTTATATLPQHKLRPPVLGGATRQTSVLAGLQALAATLNPPRLVLIHDAARPFVSSAVIDSVIGALLANVAAVSCVQVADTLKRASKNGLIEATVPRDNLWRAHTPQGFAFPMILAAHLAAEASGLPDFTDDASLAEWRGIPIKILPGDVRNIKLTTPEDFIMAEKLLETSSPPDVRVGHGFDVHKFTSGNHVWLCGVKIAHTHGVDAHSDGDVALHALTDALLGAIGDGDIGLHFKNTDPRWKGASSDQFLADAARRVAAQQGRITSVDVTILCEAPKIGPHRDAMRARIADILALTPNRVGVKATTTEQLGFAGRREGLAAMATATVVFP